MNLKLCTLTGLVVPDLHHLSGSSRTRLHGLNALARGVPASPAGVPRLDVPDPARDARIARSCHPAPVFVMTIMSASALLGACRRPRVGPVLRDDSEQVGIWTTAYRWLPARRPPTLSSARTSRPTVGWARCSTWGSS